MSAVDENIVREYFERNGFLVRQVLRRERETPVRRKPGGQESDLLIYNPSFDASARKPGFFLFASEIPRVHRALVMVKDAYTSRFSQATPLTSARIARFVEKSVLKKGEQLKPAAPDSAEAEDGSELLKVLVIPAIPTSEPYLSQCAEWLQDKGIDGVLSFRSMLLDVLDKVEVSRGNEKSEILEVLRVLKKYDLVAPPQLELFDKPGPR